MRRDHRRWIAGALLASAVLVAGSPGASAQQPSTAATPTPTPIATGTENAGEAACDAAVGSGAVSELCGLGDKVEVPIVETSVGWVEGLAVRVWRQLVEWFAEAVHLLLEALVFIVGVTTRIDLRAQWFADQFVDMLRVGGMVTVPLFLAAVLRGLLVDRAEVGRALSMLPIAALLSVVALPATQLFVATVDAVAGGYQTALGSSVEKLAVLLGAAVEPLAAPAGVVGLTGAALGFLVVGGFLMFAAFVVWLELVLRQAGVYLVVLFLPLAFAGLVWSPTRAWLARLAQAFAALVLSKFVIVVVLATAAAALEAMAADWLGISDGMVIGSDGTADALMADAGPLELLSVLALGVALVGLAAFAPYAVWRLIPIAAAQAGGAFEGVLRSRTATIGRPHPVQASYRGLANLDRLRSLGHGASTSQAPEAGRSGDSSGAAAAASEGSSGGAAVGGGVAAAAAAAQVASRARDATVGRAERAAERLGDSLGGDDA